MASHGDQHGDSPTTGSVAAGLFSASEWANLDFVGFMSFMDATMEFMDFMSLENRNDLVAQYESLGNDTQSFFSDAIAGHPDHRTLDEMVRVAEEDLLVRVDEVVARHVPYRRLRPVLAGEETENDESDDPEPGPLEMDEDMKLSVEILREARRCYLGIDDELDDPEPALPDAAAELSPEMAQMVQVIRGAVHEMAEQGIPLAQDIIKGPFDPLGPDEETTKKLCRILQIHPVARNILIGQAHMASESVDARQNIPDLEWYDATLLEDRTGIWGADLPYPGSPATRDAPEPNMQLSNRSRRSPRRTDRPYPQDGSDIYLNTLIATYMDRKAKKSAANGKPHEPEKKSPGRAEEAIKSATRASVGGRSCESDGTTSALGTEFPAGNQSHGRDEKSSGSAGHGPIPRNGQRRVEAVGLAADRDSTGGGVAETVEEAPDSTTQRLTRSQARERYEEAIRSIKGPRTRSQTQERDDTTPCRPAKRQRLV